MKQNISSAATSLSPTGDYEHFDARTMGSSDEENCEFLAEGLIHLTTLLQNQTQNEPQCAECQQIITGIINYLNLFDSYLACEDCGEALFDFGNYKESVLQNNNSPAMHMSIRLSCPKTKKLEKNVQILKNKIETMNNNIQNLMVELDRLKNSWRRISQECSSLQINCHQHNTTINELKSKQDKSEQDLIKIKQEMQDLHFATYDGSIIWIIDEFKKKFAEAELGKRTCIYSPIFYSSPSGYEMRARLDLYGDGDARGTHMSIFLVIYKGQYDAILTWPFSYQVTFCLYDQTGQGHHIIDSFYPDIKSPSFQRPRSQENIASGILKFLPLAALQQQEIDYVSNDRMYIQVRVDFLGTPRSVLPYTLSINPGLPILEQDVISSRIIDQQKKMRAKLVAQIHADDQEVEDRSLLPVHPPAPAGIPQQPSPSTTNSESISCEDILHE